MIRFISALLAIILVATVSGCTPKADSSFGFKLPDGDAAAGRDTFLYMQCNQCHTIRGETFPAIPLADPPYIELGGNVSTVKTYGELVTAIINPSHKLANGYAKEVVSEDGLSNMYIYNRYMTVQELTDIVMYLQPHYKVVIPKFQYRIYP